MHTLAKKKKIKLLLLLLYTLVRPRKRPNITLGLVLK